MILPIWVKPAIAAVALAGAFSAGWAVNGWRWEAKQAEALKRAQIAFQKQLSEVNREARQYEQEREVARQTSLTRQEIIRTIYRDRPPPPDCAAPDAVRSVLTDAVREANARSGAEPRAAVQPDS